MTVYAQPNALGGDVDFEARSGIVRETEMPMLEPAAQPKTMLVNDKPEADRSFF